MKRFWKQAAIVEQDGGWAIALDGKPMQTPAGHAYRCPTQALAKAVAAEWDAVKDKVDPKTMPLTQLVATALDIMPVKRAEIVEQLIAYTATDLLCYRAAHPPALAAQQMEVWQPFLDWAVTEFDALLKVAPGIQPLQQDPHAVQSLRRAVEAWDDFRLTALQNAVTITGSLVLGLALIYRWRDAETIFAAAELDTTFQIERWGAEEEIVARRAAIKIELHALADFIGLTTA